MDDNESNKSVKEEVLAAIKSGQIKMRPKWHFLLKAALAGVGGLIIILALLYLGSFIVFVMRQTGVWDVPGFGLNGWFVFLVSLPWVLVLLLIIFILLLEILVRRYSFAYRSPLFFSALFIVFIVLIGGYVVGRTPLHGRLLEYAERNMLPVAGPLYTQFGHQRFNNIHRGVIVGAKPPDSFLIKTRRNEILTIILIKFISFSKFSFKNKAN